jgi:hypothetical protein
VDRVDDPQPLLPSCIVWGRMLLASLITIGLLASCTSTAAPGSTAAVPGGAADVAPSGSPKVCTQLADSSAIHDLGASLTAMASQPTATARTQLKAASVSLRELASHSGELDRALIAVGTNLEALASANTPADSELVAVESSLSELGEEVQGVCHFPVGQG